LFPEVKDILSDLKENYVLGILSNTDNETLFLAIKHTGLEMDYVLTSEEARSYKPNTDIFLRACNDLGLNKDKVVYVGNSLNDIVGAKKAGLIMIHVNRQKVPLNSPLYLPDHEVESLQPVPSIIRTYKTIN
jgi:2-haloalkanoic acid dehalogenase type II